MEHPPEVFERVKTVNFVQNILVMPSSLALLLLLVVTQRVNIPKCPPISNVCENKSKIVLTHCEFRSFHHSFFQIQLPVGQSGPQ